MDIKNFITKYRRVISKTFPGGQYPLRFDTSNALLEDIDSFSVIDDFISQHEDEDSEGEDFIDLYKRKFPHYVPIAIADIVTAEKQDPNFDFDSYGEFFLVVDTSQEKQPVYFWSSEGNFELQNESLEEFQNTLVDWKPIK